MGDLFKQETAASKLIEFGMLRHVADDIADRDDDHPERQMIFQGQGKILLALMQEDHLAQKELAARLNLTAQSTAEFVRKLEKKGFVTRMKSPTDQRVTVVSITDAGRQETTKNVQQIPPFLTILDDMELDQLSHILDKINQHMYEEVNAANPTWFNKFHQAIMNRMLSHLHSGEDR